MILDYGVHIGTRMIEGRYDDYYQVGETDDWICSAMDRVYRENHMQHVYKRKRRQINWDFDRAYVFSSTAYVRKQDASCFRGEYQPFLGFLDALAQAYLLEQKNEYENFADRELAIYMAITLKDDPQVAIIGNVYWYKDGTLAWYPWGGGDPLLIGRVEGGLVIPDDQETYYWW